MLITIIGAMGQGKTLLAKTLIKNHKNIWVFDVNREYSEYGRNAIYPEFEDFLTMCDNGKIRGAKVVLEEMTAFLQGAIARRATKIFIGTRHSGNDYILLFHDIKSVPPKIYSFSKLIFLLKTYDSEPLIKHKYPELLNLHLRLKSGDGIVKKITGKDGTKIPVRFLTLQR